MLRITLSALAASLLALGLCATTAHAQPPRVFVAAQGSDSNPCSFAAPCRTFQHAHDVVPAGGEINLLDPAGYGAVTITKAISIQGHGFAGITVPSAANAITINAGFGDKISLRGLLLDGTGVGAFGIEFNTALSLMVQDCVVRSFSKGMFFHAKATTTQQLAVSNSYFIDGHSGITMQTENVGTLTVAVDRTGFYNNTGGGLNADGSFGTGGLYVAVTDSVSANNQEGFTVQTFTGQSVVNFSVTHSLVEGNVIGLSASGTNATLWLAQSTLTGNAAGFQLFFSATIQSFLDNYITANGANMGSLTAATKQ
jgi:hypothetical protein